LKSPTIEDHLIIQVSTGVTMSAKQVRFYCRPIIPGQIVLPSRQVHHLHTVLRLGLGQTVELFDGAGALAQGQIVNLTRRQVTLQVEHIEQIRPPDKPRIVIAASLAKGQRFDGIVTKCTELGVDRICPVIFDRTVKLAQGAHTLERYEKLTIAAAQQCQRLFLPRIDPVASLQQCLEILQNDYPQSQLLVGSSSVQAQSLLTEKLTGDTIAFVGPEGGITDQEIHLFRQHNAQPIHLTRTILRIETAAISFAAILCTLRDTANDT